MGRRRCRRFKRAAGRMYVCICNALKDRELAKASNGARTVSEVFKTCGKRPKCGKCLPDVAEMIEAAREKSGAGVKFAAE